MDTATVLGFEVAPDPLHARTAELVERTRARASAGSLRAALLEVPGLARHAAALVRFVLEDDDDGPPLAASDADVVLDATLLALAADDHAHVLYVDDVHDDSHARSGSDGDDESATLGPALAEYLAQLRAALGGREGWPAGCAAFAAALGTLTDVLARDRQLGGLGPSMSYRDDAETAGADLVATTAAIVRNDRTTMLHPSECELALRLANGVVARAREVLAFTASAGPARPHDVVARRFAVPDGLIRLGGAELERCMRAIFAAELLDLGDLLAELDADAPFRRVLARTVHGMVRLRDAVGELTIAGVQPQHDAIMHELRVVARLDGHITADERALLRGMDEHLHDFDALVARIQEDRVVDFEEFRQLRTSRQLILDDLLRIALADDVISDDERSLLVRVLELLPMLRPAR